MEDNEAVEPAKDASLINPETVPYYIKESSDFPALRVPSRTGGGERTSWKCSGSLICLELLGFGVDPQPSLSRVEFQ